MSAKTNNLEKELERLGLVHWQISHRKEYYQDAGCLKKLQAAKTLEKDVLSISKVDTDYLVYTGSEELHPLTRVATLVDAYVTEYSVDELEDNIRDLNAIVVFGKLDLHVPYPQYVPVGI